jgi:hypothetical protein
MRSLLPKPQRKRGRPPKRQKRTTWRTFNDTVLPVLIVVALGYLALTIILMDQR